MKDPVAEQHRSYCRFCIALCGVVVTTEGDRVVKVAGDPDHPQSRGYTCSKGRMLGVMHHGADRLDHPLARRDGALVPVTWDECIDDIAVRVREITASHGPSAVGMYLGTGSAFDANGRRAAEKLLASLGSRSKYTSTTVDTPCKPLVSELMSGHPGLVPAVDADNATLTILIGSNPVVSHGHLNAFPDPVVRLRTLTSQGEMWVLDPRRTETAKLATRHVAPRAGTDYAVVAHLVRELLRDGADRAYLAEHATGTEELRAAVESFDRDTTIATAGVPGEDLDDLLAAIRRHGRVAAQTGTGSTMSAAANVTEWLVWALHIVTASYDRPGGMWFHPGFLKQLDTRRFEATDAVPAPGPPSRPDLPSRWGEYPCAAMSDEIEAGNLRALFVVGANPVTSLPETERLVAALSGLDLLVVADVVETDATELATHVLPCAGPLERADLPHYIDQFQPTVATQYSRAVVPLSEERRPMWWAFARLGEELGLDVLPDGLTADTASDDELLRRLADRSRRSFGDLVEAETSVVSETAVYGWVEERVLPDGRWRIAPSVLVDQLATLAEPAPLVLTPRRQPRHLNSQLRDVAGPAGRKDDPDVLLHPADAVDLGLVDGGAVVVESGHGRLAGVARFDPDLRRGAVSIPHGFAAANVSMLTSAKVGADPLTGMVLQSGVPVRVRRDPVVEPGRQR